MDERLKALLAEVLRLPPSAVTGQLTMKDVESWDSLKHMELIVAIEEKFGVQLSFGEIVIMNSVEGIRRVLAEKGVTI